MNNPFAQSPATYKIHFKTIFQDLEKFEALYAENCLSIASYEMESETIDSKADDIWCLEIYLDHQPDVQNLQKQLLDYAEHNNLKLLNQLESEKIEDLDWVSEYQKNLKPIEIGRFFVTSSMQAHLCPEDKINLIIEASRAFGTGEHNTTAGCIKAMEFLATKTFNNVIDIGTGSGILSFVAKKIWPKASIYACDIEKVAVEIAAENAKINNVEINFFQNTAEQIWQQEKTVIKFDLIISNILAKPLIDLASEIKNLSTNNTYIILSGFLKDQIQDIKNAYSSFNIESISEDINKNWAVITMINKENQ